MLSHKGAGCTDAAYIACSAAADAKRGKRLLIQPFSDRPYPCAGTKCIAAADDQPAGLPSPVLQQRQSA